MCPHLSGERGGEGTHDLPFPLSAQYDLGKARATRSPPVAPIIPGVKAGKGFLPGQRLQGIPMSGQDGVRWFQVKPFVYCVNKKQTAEEDVVS